MKKIIKYLFQEAKIGIKDPIALLNIETFLSDYSKYKTSDYVCLDILKSQSENFVSKPIEIIGYISKIHTPYPIELTNSNEEEVRISVTSLSIKDKSNNTIDTFELQNDEISSFISDLPANSLLKFKGTLISVSQLFISQYFFLLKEISSEVDQMDYLKSSI